MLLPEMHLTRRRASDSPHGVGRWEPPAGFRYPLLNFPGHRRRAQNELQRSRRVPPRRPKRRPQAREISYSASLSGWVSPVALRFRLGHRPVIHRAHPAAPRGFALWRPLGFPLTQTAWAAALVGVGTCYESPVTETPGLQGCLEDHATGTVQDMGPACSRHGRKAAWCRRKIWKGPSTAAPELCQPDCYCVLPRVPHHYHHPDGGGTRLYPRSVSHLGSNTSHRRL